MAAPAIKMAASAPLYIPMVANPLITTYNGLEFCRHSEPER
nr:hypothetical protein [uncultured Desulfobacter sp.]